jgi:hypothetical protein
MSSSTALTGRNGEFYVGGTFVERCTQWAVNPTLATSSEWGDSNSCGFTNRAPGRMDCTFTAEGKFDTDARVYNVFFPGDILAAALFLRNSAIAYYWYFPRAMCTDFQLTVNIDTEEVIGWTSSWGSDGVFYKPGASGIQSIAARSESCNDPNGVDGLA